MVCIGLTAQNQSIPARPVAVCGPEASSLGYAQRPDVVLRVDDYHQDPCGERGSKPRSIPRMSDANDSATTHDDVIAASVIVVGYASLS